MITISDIEISRFRSIRDAKFEDLHDFSVLAGLNNSGKSNFLRALNLFFTGRPEPELLFNLARDYYRGELSAKKKKNIRISVHFTLPKTFRFRGGLKSVEDLLGRDFTITKEWAFRQTDTTVYLNGSTTPLRELSDSTLTRCLQKRGQRGQTSSLPIRRERLLSEKRKWLH